VPGSWEPFGPTRRMDRPGVDPAAEPAAAEAAPASAALPPQRRQPRRRLAIVTCMDARIDPLAILGLSLGDANVIRNAGATVSDDVLRSLRAAVERLGVARAVLIGHTDCAGHDSDASAAASVADGARRLRGALPDGFGVDAFMYDVATGALDPL
jgi:carbonic anhydrase